MPESERGLGVQHSPLWAGERLEKEVVQHERGIEGRVSEVNHFEIDSHHLRGAHQEILRAPISMTQTDAAKSRLCNQPSGVGGKVGMSAGSDSVIGIDPQLIK